MKIYFVWFAIFAMVRYFILFVFMNHIGLKSFRIELFTTIRSYFRIHIVLNSATQSNQSIFIYRLNTHHSVSQRVRHRVLNSVLDISKRSQRIQFLSKSMNFPEIVMESNCLSEIVFEFIKLFSLLIDIVIKTIIVSKYFRKQFPIILKVCQMTLVP